jgi:hypothetical protein
MASLLRFHPDVLIDLRDAIAWYTEISPRLANRFRESVDRSLDQIETDPLMYAILFDDVHVVQTSAFPYLVQYRIRRDNPFVLGIFHGASDSGKWRARAQA